MVIPAPGQTWSVTDPEIEWSRLSAEAKHERILAAAGLVFTRDGLDAPIPEIAAVAGAGIGSVYRQFPSKRELLAALVIRRLELTESSARTASERTGDHWDALVEMLWTIVERQSGDDFLGEAMAQVGDHPDVIAAKAITTEALGQLLRAAQAEGRLRPDATTRDIHLLFAATRAAKHVEPEGWQRMLQLLIDGLAAEGAEDGSGSAHRPSDWHPRSD